MSKIFTRYEVTYLDQYPILSAAGIAAAIGVTENTVYRWLKMLGTPLARIVHMKPKQPIGKVCQRCGIKLAAAARMDGGGNGEHCAYCLSIIAGNPWVTRAPLGGGDAPELKVFWAFGQAAGRDVRVMEL